MYKNTKIDIFTEKIQINIFYKFASPVNAGWFCVYLNAFISTCTLYNYEYMYRACIPPRRVLNRVFTINDLLQVCEIKGQGLQITTRRRARVKNPRVFATFCLLAMLFFHVKIPNKKKYNKTLSGPRTAEGSSVVFRTCSWHIRSRNLPDGRRPRVYDLSSRSYYAIVGFIKRRFI